MSSILALIPARSGSKGIPNKNLRLLGGRSLMNRAIDLCNELRGTLQDFIVSSDIDWAANERVLSDEPAWRYGHWLLRPAELAQDDTPMIAVVQHALQQIPGPPDQIIVLLQPTAVFRTPEHVKQAIALLEESGADSVVSVVPVPKTHAPEFHLYVTGCPDRLTLERYQGAWTELPPRRQAVCGTWLRDGTVYAFRRQTVDRYQNIYGQDVRPLLIDPADSCELDTEADWQAVEKRWNARAQAPRS